MGASIITVWLLIGGNGPLPASPQFANYQSCEHVRTNMEYPKHFKCIQAQVYLTIPLK